MTYFNYHAKVQNKIKKQELKCYQYVDNYKKIGKVMLLSFYDGSSFPIRPNKFFEYICLIESLYEIKNENNVNYTNYLYNF